MQIIYKQSQACSIASVMEHAVK